LIKMGEKMKKNKIEENKEEYITEDITISSIDNLKKEFREIFFDIIKELSYIQTHDDGDALSKLDIIKHLFSLYNNGDGICTAGETCVRI